MLTHLLYAGTLETSSPSMKIAPSLWPSNPAIILNVVVLPHPLGPKIVKNSPLFISRETLSTAKELLSKNFLLTFLIEPLPQSRKSPLPYNIYLYKLKLIIF